PATVTYGFEATNDWTQFNDDEIAAAFDALQLWSDVANISFNLVVGSNPYQIGFVDYADSSSQGVASTSNIGPSSGGGPVTVGFNLDPGVDSSGNQISATFQELAPGEEGFMDLIHEIGHAIGLSHPGDYNAGPEGTGKITYADDRGYVEDSRQYSIMSYF